ncbi:hypothetical protein [Microbacterium sp. YJN-G]|uniref:hypothetical protein n=1 Tax=Microbacterium sp. YJN-G TaxID=2763257 RepID=UPI0018786217|nr:hypothetical protein [Microbacterium sp. YJN-G]
MSARPTRVRRAPLAPWRFVLVATAIIVAALVAVPAANPVFNGADLGVLIALAIFIAAFTTSGRD